MKLCILLLCSIKMPLSFRYLRTRQVYTLHVIASRLTTCYYLLTTETLYKIFIFYDLNHFALLGQVCILLESVKKVLGLAPN